ncbi:MAG: EpsG family protein, partial [Clostridia bacterium]|nr:EpsG family protein [Clostridia bacterium]
ILLMVYIVAFLLEMAVIFRKRFMKHNNAVALSFCFVLFMFVVGGFNSTNPDYEVYRSLYFDRFPGNYSVTEPLYVFLNKFVYSTGLPFNCFFAVHVLISLFFMQKAILFFSKNSDIVWGYYLLFPFAISIVQIRYALASSIVIYAFTFLYRYHTEHKALLQSN